MTNKQIASLLQKLIPYYKDCAEAIQDAYIGGDGTYFFEAIQRYARDKKINSGICFCASWIFDTNIYGFDWIQKYVMNGSYWTITIEQLGTYHAIIASLNYRIELMEKILKEYDTK